MVFEYRRSNIKASKRHKATVTSEAKTARTVTMAADTLAEEPPEVPSGYTYSPGFRGIMYGLLPTTLRSSEPATSGTTTSTKAV